MPTAVALVFILEGVLIVGMILLLTGVVLVVRARRRSTPARTPVIITGIGFGVALAAAIALGIDATLHLTTDTSTHLG